MAGTILSLDEQALPPGLDTRFLREQARLQIERLAGERWTDYNSSDPGITMLEVLAYAITDLGLRTRLGMADLVAQGGDKPFFTAGELLPPAASTLEDYRRLLIDNPDIRNAWIEQSPGNIKGLYTLLLDFEPVDELDLGAVWLKGTTPLVVNNRMYEFYAVFPYWDELPKVWTENLDFTQIQLETGAILPTEPEKDIYEQYFIKPTFTFGAGAGQQTLNNPGLWIRLPQGIPKADNEEFRTKLQAQLNGKVSFFKPHLERVRLRKKRLDKARDFILQHRNLCEDWDDINTVRIQQIGLRVEGLELQPDADPAEVIARIYFLIEQFIDPDIRAKTFDDLLALDLTPAEIFEGPLLENGFIPADSLNPVEREDNIYTSDLIRIIMEQPEVIGVNRLTLDLFLDRIKAATGVANCLRLRNPRLYKPKFSFYDSDIRVKKRDVPVEVTAATIKTRWLNFKSGISNAAPGGESTDFPVPAGDRELDIATFHSIQHDFPETYGLREGEILSTAPPRRIAQARQLKGYLLFFEQLLANYCAQLANIQTLFSTSSDAGRTAFFQPLYDVPAVRDLYREFLLEKEVDPSVTWEQFKQHCNGYIKVLDEATENRDAFLRRRNQFIDHLLARFSETFSDYAAWSYARNGGLASPDHVLDKLDFLQRMPELCAPRATAFNYAATRAGAGGQPVPDVWNTANVSGYEKRVAALVGIPDYRRRTLGEKFDILRYREVTNIQGTGLNRKGRFRIFNAPVPGASKILLVSTEAYLLTQLDNRIREVADRGQYATAYWQQPKEDPNHPTVKCQYTFSLAEPNDTQPDQPGSLLPATAPPDFLAGRGPLEAHIRETMHLLQGRPVEGMHVVEHVLLRPVTGTTQQLELEPVIFQGGGPIPFIPEPYSFQVSIFLPGWAPRFEDAEFRAVVERSLRHELPTHIFPYIYWVELTEQQQIPAQFIAFETAWRNWLENLFTPARSTARHQLVEAINQLVSVDSLIVTPAYRYQAFDPNR